MLSGHFLVLIKFYNADENDDEFKVIIRIAKKWIIFFTQIGFISRNGQFLKTFYKFTSLFSNALKPASD